MDSQRRAECQSLVKPHLSCPVHAAYKVGPVLYCTVLYCTVLYCEQEYQEHLLNYKNWCIVICTFLSVPLCLFCWTVGTTIDTI